MTQEETTVAVSDTFVGVGSGKSSRDEGASDHVVYWLARLLS